MKIFPSERDRQKSDTRTVSWFFYVMFWLTIVFFAIVGGYYLLGGK